MATGQGRPPSAVLAVLQRSYSTARDATITEYGGAFTLTTIDPDDPQETKGIVIKWVAVASDCNILVGSGEETMARRFAIGWANKFTFEP